MHEKKNTLQQGGKFAIFSHAIAKSIVSRRKLNQNKKANRCTPLACFFICRLRTPKENHPLIKRVVLLSMVGRRGQRLGVGCFPFWTVFLPLYALPPAVGKLAESLMHKKETAKMKTYLFKFLSLTTGKTTPCIIARNEDEARQKHGKNERLTMVYRSLNPYPVLTAKRSDRFSYWGIA